MSDGIGLAEVLLGPPLDVVEHDTEMVIRLETKATRAFCETCGVRAEPQDRLRVDVRSGLLRTAGTSGVVEAAVALSGTVVCGADVDRALRAR
jgi:hypothetical protein